MLLAATLSSWRAPSSVFKSFPAPYTTTSEYQRSTAAPTRARLPPPTRTKCASSSQRRCFTAHIRPHMGSSTSGCRQAHCKHPRISVRCHGIWKAQDSLQVEPSLRCGTRTLKTRMSPSTLSLRLAELIRARQPTSRTMRARIRRGSAYGNVKQHCRFIIWHSRPMGRCLPRLARVTDSSRFGTRTSNVSFVFYKHVLEKFCGRE